MQLAISQPNSALIHPADVCGLPTAKMKLIAERTHLENIIIIPRQKPAAQSRRYDTSH
jgi:hypothetical protein